MNEDRQSTFLIQARDLIAKLKKENQLLKRSPSFPGKMSIRRGGFISDIDIFDSSFFGQEGPDIWPLIPLVPLL